MARLKRVLAATAVTAAAIGTAAPAQAGGPSNGSDVRVVATGLDGPRELQFVNKKSLVVAESDSGEITRVNVRSGAQQTLVSGLSSPQGVDERGGKLFIAVGGPAPDAPPPPAGTFSALLTAPLKGGPATLFKDLLAFELANNPDQQTQFVNGQPVDSVSNPYYVLTGRHSVLVADAGGNDVLRIDRKTGNPSVFFLPPVVTTGACEGAENNPGTTGCDPVPTGLAYGPHGSLYVSTLGAEVPGAARVYKLDGKGRVRKVYGDFTGATGVAVGRDGSVYVSELTYGAPEGDGPPPPGFDPSKVGRIIRIAPNGHRTYAQVTMPSGLIVHRGTLYASAWSIAGFLGMQHAGQIVAVSPSAFH